MYVVNDCTVWLAYNSEPYNFLFSLKHNYHILNDIEKVYKLAIINAVQNQDLTPVQSIRGYCYKIPKKCIRFARKFDFPELHQYLEGNEWLSYLGGF